MNQIQWNTEQQNDLGYGELFAKLWHRRLLFLGVCGGVLAISIPVIVMKQPLYQSYMQVLVESNYQGKELKGNNKYLESEFADAAIEIDYATQLRVLKSSAILNKVINQLLPEESEEAKAEALLMLKKSLAVSQLAKEDSESKSKNEDATNILQAVYTDNSPTQTKRVLETIQEVYLEYNLEQQEKRLRDGLTFIDNQIPQARNDLIEVEAALTKLSQEYNLISPEEEAIALKNNIRQITQEREALKAQQSQIKGDYTSIQKQLGLTTENSLALSRLSQSPRYQNLLNKLQEAEINLANERTKFTDDNPIIQNSINQRDSQKALLVDEAEKILGEVPPNFIEELESAQKQGQLVDSDTSFVDKITQAQSSLSGIRERDATLARTKAELEQKLIGFPVLISEYRDMTQKAQIKRNALQRLLEAKQELEIELNRGGFNWQVIEPPQLGVKIAPNLLKDLLLSLVVASFLGATAVFIRETMDERINNPREIESQTTLPILGTTPGLSLSNRLLAQIPFGSNFSPEVSVKEVIQWQPFRESVDLIYENLRLSYVSSSLKSLAVTSAVAGEGKSTFVLGLALSVARHQRRVLIIDADLRRPSLHKLFAIENQSGLTNFLAGEIDRPVIKQVSLMGETVDLISSGSISSDPVKLLSSVKLQYCINQQKQNYDLILIDTPSVLGMVDAIKVASISDSAVLMMRLDKVKVSELTEATSVLSKLNVLGIVANDSKEGTMQYQTKSQNLLPQQV